jgi:orotidine-5'-phosphate decarboxylase
MQPHEKIIVALDVSTLDDVKRHVEQLAPYVGCFKIGLELLTAVGGPAAVAAIHDVGGKVMYDGKFNDIPATMAGAARSVGALGAEMFTLHASSGIKGMRAVADAKGKSLALAVTVLTSFDDEACKEVFVREMDDTVMGFALDAALSDMDGIVCAASVLPRLRPRIGFAWLHDDYAVKPYECAAKLLKVTPGIRPAWAEANDQKRVSTPGDAILLGADLLVIGRPILKPPPSIGSSVEAAKRIADEIGDAMERKVTP